MIIPGICSFASFCFKLFLQPKSILKRVKGLGTQTYTWKINTLLKEVSHFWISRAKTLWFLNGKTAYHSDSIFSEKFINLTQFWPVKNFEKMFKEIEWLFSPEGSPRSWTEALLQYFITHLLFDKNCMLSLDF